MKLALGLVLALTACQAPSPAHPYVPQDAAASTFQIRVAVDGELSWSGTGWIADSDDTGSLLITAGHVCREAEPDEKLSFSARDSLGTDYDLELIRIAPVYDLCLLGTTKYLGRQLDLSPVAPKYDDPVMMVGAPQWVWGCESDATITRCGMAPISRGNYAGGTLVSMPATHGFSGGAVLTKYGVIGVLVEGYSPFDSLSFIEPLDHIREFLSE